MNFSNQKMVCQYKPTLFFFLMKSNCMQGPHPAFLQTLHIFQMKPKLMLALDCTAIAFTKALTLTLLKMNGVEASRCIFFSKYSFSLIMPKYNVITQHLNFQKCISLQTAHEVKLYACRSTILPTCNPKFGISYEY